MKRGLWNLNSKTLLLEINLSLTRSITQSDGIMWAIKPMDRWMAPPAKSNEKLATLIQFRKTTTTTTITNYNIPTKYLISKRATGCFN